MSDYEKSEYEKQMDEVFKREADIEFRRKLEEKYAKSGNSGSSGTGCVVLIIGISSVFFFYLLQHFWVFPN